jgi:hypothetical protein
MRIASTGRNSTPSALSVTKPSSKPSTSDPSLLSQGPVKMLRLSRTLPLSIRHASTAAATTSSTSSSAAKFSPLAMKAAEEVSSKWKGTTANGGKTQNYIGGEFKESSSDKWLEVRDPVCPISSSAVLHVRRLISCSLHRLWSTWYQRRLSPSSMLLSMPLLRHSRLGPRLLFYDVSKSCSSKSSWQPARSG